MMLFSANQIAYIFLANDNIYYFFFFYNWFSIFAALEQNEQILGLSYEIL